MRMNNTRATRTGNYQDHLEQQRRQEELRLAKFRKEMLDELLFMNSKVGSTIHKPTSFSAFKLETTINLAGVGQLVECQLPKRTFLTSDRNGDGTDCHVYHPLNDELERTPFKIIIQELMSLLPPL